MLFIHWIVSAIAIGLAAFVIPGVTVTTGGALLAAVVIGVLNLFIKPLIVFLTLPVNILTLGLFTLVINGFIIWLAGSFTPGFKVDGFLIAIIFSIVLTAVNIIFGYIGGWWS